MSKSQDWHDGRAVGLREGKDMFMRYVAEKLYADIPQSLAEQVAAEAEQRGESNGPDVRDGTFQIEE